MTTKIAGVMPCIIVLLSLAYSEPIVLKGSAIPSLLGKQIANIRMCDAQGTAIPFQIDEKTPDGEFVCNQGSVPNENEGNGIFDSSDEMVFLREDAALKSDTMLPSLTGTTEISITSGSEKRAVYLSENPGGFVSAMNYIEYDAGHEMVRTPYYFAVFGKQRFHFIKAGIKNFTTGDYIELANVLRIDIIVKLLGFIPIHYTEENIICLVQRYKVGPIRLIRRGDFHLNVGLGIKGSRAAVNQICYPDMVGVPVSVHLPVRFKNIASEAYIEMAPSIAEAGKKYSFKVPGGGISLSFKPDNMFDTLINIMPDNTFFRIDDGLRGFGWLLKTDMDNSYLTGSGFIYNQPSERAGIADCGFRLGLRDLPRGNYVISNWVVFSSKSASDLANACEIVQNPAAISLTGTGAVVRNSLAESGEIQQNKKPKRK